jgi:hypothetical protein
MRTISRRLLPGLIFLFTCAAAFSAATIDGKWSGKLNGPDGEIEMILDLKTTGEDLTGTATFPMAPAFPISNGKVTDTAVSFDLVFAEMSFTLPFRGRLDGEALKLSIQSPIGEDSVTFTRVPAN